MASPPRRRLPGKTNVGSPMSVGFVPVQIDNDIVQAIQSPEAFGGMVAASKFIVDRLRASGLASEVVLAPAKLGVHPCNRSKMGCHEDTVHQLLADIVEVGWNTSKVLGGLCVQEDAQDRQIEAFNAKLCKDSAFLAPIEPRSIIAGTLTNGHTVLGLRAAMAGVKCEIPSISIDGRMTLVHLGHHQPEMIKAAQEGWTWTMLSSECRGYGDGLFEFLSQAANIQLARTESEVEVMLKLFRTAAALETSKTSIDWGSIAKQALRTKPECASYMHVLCQWVQQLGGGSKASFIADLSRFHRKFVSGQRTIGGEFFEHLMKTVFGTKDKNEPSTDGVLLRYAIVKCMYSGPEDKLKGRQCTFLKMSDVDQLAKKNLALACRAENILAQCRAILLQHSNILDESKRTKLLANLDVSMIRVVMAKQQTSAVKHASIEALAFTFIADMQAFVGQALVIHNPWASFSPTASTPAEVKPSDRMQTINAMGELAIEPVGDRLAAKGFVIGGKVMLKGSTGHPHDFAGAHSDSVKLFDNALEEVTVPMEAFLSQWVPYSEEAYPYVPEVHGHTHLGFELAGVKGIAMMALNHLSDTIGMPNVVIMAKPLKRACALQTYKSKELLLLPETLNIAASVGDSKPTNGLQVTVDGFSRAALYCMPSPFGADIDKHPMNVPLWAVRTTSQAKLANMEFIKVQCTVGCESSGKRKSKSVVSFEALTNNKVLKNGDELLFFKAKAEDAKGKKPRTV